MNPPEAKVAALGRSALDVIISVSAARVAEVRRGAGRPTVYVSAAALAALAEAVEACWPGVPAEARRVADRKGSSDG